MLDIYQMYDKELGIFMYKYNNGLLLTSFDNVFEHFESIHNYDTRHEKNYRPQNHKIKTILCMEYPSRKCPKRK